jgi:hypothetical protein
MFHILEKEIDNIIHDILKVVNILKTIENEEMTVGQKIILHGCETRLMEIRQHLVEVCQDTDKTNKEDKNE